MPLLSYVANFFAGAFLLNCIPHLVAGVWGEPFPSPFAKPPGVGLSSPPVNVAWGTLNLAVGAILLARNPVSPGINLPFAIFLLGWLALGFPLARHFQNAKLERQKRRLGEFAA
jgi:hypothetical protein